MGGDDGALRIEAHLARAHGVGGVDRHLLLGRVVGDPGERLLLGEGPLGAVADAGVDLVGSRRKEDLHDGAERSQELAAIRQRELVLDLRLPAPAHGHATDAVIAHERAAHRQVFHHAQAAHPVDAAPGLRHEEDLRRRVVCLEQDARLAIEEDGVGLRDAVPGVDGLRDEAVGAGARVDRQVLTDHAGAVGQVLVEQEHRRRDRSGCEHHGGRLHAEGAHALVRLDVANGGDDAVGTAAGHQDLLYPTVRTDGRAVVLRHRDEVPVHAALAAARTTELTDAATHAARCVPIDEVSIEPELLHTALDEQVVRAGLERMHLGDADDLLDLVVDRREHLRHEVVQAPALEHVIRRTIADRAVDQRRAADAAARGHRVDRLGLDEPVPLVRVDVVDRPAVAGRELARFVPVALLEDDHFETASGELLRARRAACAGAHHHYVRLQRSIAFEGLRVHVRPPLRRGPAAPGATASSRGTSPSPLARSPARSRRPPRGASASETRSASGTWA